MDNSKLRLYAYNKCSTCRNAAKWLRARDFAFEVQDIVEHPPDMNDLIHWVVAEGVPLKKFLNTSGQLYRELNLKEQLPRLTQDDILALLTSLGKLLKRPLLTDGKKVLVGFNEEEWAATLLK